MRIFKLNFSIYVATNLRKQRYRPRMTISSPFGLENEAVVDLPGMARVRSNVS
jgi:hypothetical protein